MNVQQIPGTKTSLQQCILVRHQPFVHISFLTATPQTATPQQHKTLRMRVTAWLVLRGQCMQDIPFRVKLTEDPNQLNCSTAHLLIIICQELAGLKEESQSNIPETSPAVIHFPQCNQHSYHKTGQIKNQDESNLPFYSLVFPSLIRQTSPNQVNQACVVKLQNYLYYVGRMKCESAVELIWYRLQLHSFTDITNTSWVLSNERGFKTSGLCKTLWLWLPDDRNDFITLSPSHDHLPNKQYIIKHICLSAFKHHGCKIPFYFHCYRTTRNTGNLSAKYSTSAQYPPPHKIHCQRIQKERYANKYKTNTRFYLTINSLLQL